MNRVISTILNRALPDIRNALKDNREAGRDDLIRLNAVSGYLQNVELIIFLLRDGETNLVPHVKEMNLWRQLLLDSHFFEHPEEGGNIIQEMGEIGYLTHQTPNKTELEFVERHRDKLDTLDVMTWNLYAGKKPDANLPAPRKGKRNHEQLMTKYIELLMALLAEPQKSLKEFDKHYTKREKSDTWNSWHGGGPMNPFFLDPLALCLLKYKKADFDSDSPHMKGYKTLVAAGF